MVINVLSKQKFAPLSKNVWGISKKTDSENWMSIDCNLNELNIVTFTLTIVSENLNIKKVYAE
jgi:hypothetical protein